MNEDTNRLTRRESLATLGGLAVTAFGATAWGLEAATDSDSASGPAGVTSGLVGCVLTPEQTEYRRRPNRDTSKATDFVYRNGGRRSLLALRRSGAGYIGEITMGVSR